ncbi:MAG TPA: hypothetical protein PKG52_02760 [bacterium]|nr:hypothetical protein [bacterium]HPS28735.1 hypothetical protein [bacterium]
MTAIIISSLIFETGIIPSLEVYIIRYPDSGRIKNSTKAHPDLRICKVTESLAVVSPDLPQYFIDEMNYSGIEIIKGEKIPFGKYPDDIPYNCAVTENFAVHNFKYCDPVIVSTLKKLNKKLIDVKQGYSKCSICFTGKNTVITEDPEIAQAVKNNGFQSLLIGRGSIKLEGFDYGFFGGATGFIEPDTLLINGSLSTHKSAGIITDFAKANNIRIVELNQDHITDTGSIIVFNI